MESEKDGMEGNRRKKEKRKGEGNTTGEGDVRRSAIFG